MKPGCVVVGAGIVGVSCAWHLQKRGLQVTLIDHRLPGMACSFGNASCIATSGVVPLSYPGVIRKLPRWVFDPLGPVSVRFKDFPSLLPWFWKFWRAGNMNMVEDIALAQSSLMHTVAADYDEILKGAGCTHLKASRGAIHVYDTEKEYQQERWQTDLMTRLGFGVQKLSKDELESLVPDLKLENGVGLMMPDWQHLLNPARVTASIAESCLEQGGTWIQDRVTAVSADGSGVHLNTTSGRQIDADHLVVAAGAWSNAIADQLDFKVPMTAKRGYHSTIANPGLSLEYPVMSLSRGFVMTPLDNGLRVAGTAEFASLDAKPDYRRAKVLLKHAGHYLPGLQADGVTEWMGHRPMMADSLPVISPSPRHDNVFYAFGHGHYGITQGPTTGRIIAELVQRDTPTSDYAAFRFDRFV